MRRLLAILTVCLLPHAAPAQTTQPEGPLLRQADAWGSGLAAPQLLDGVACNAAAANRTWTSHTSRAQGFGVLMFQLDLTHDSATALTFLPEVSLNGGTTWATVPPCDATTDGTCALTATGQFTRAVSASENIAFRVEFMGAKDIRLTTTCTAGGASDTFDLWGRYSAR